MDFISKIYQENDCINAIDLFKDIITQINFEKEENNIDKDKNLDRTHPLQHILNSTSGGYIAPTSMKSFELCPASYLYSKLVPEKIGSATSVGSSFHEIMQKFYDSEERNLENLNYLTEQQIILDKQEASADIIRRYVKGYWETPDYIDNKPMDHESLTCSSEVFIKPNINPLNVNLNVPLYLKIDRIDVRDTGIYVGDYKTGFGDPDPYLLGENGYLPQMIFYKWGVEAEYGEMVKKAFLILPGADSIKCKYTEMNVHSLVEQSKVVEQCFHFLEDIRSIRDKLLFPERINRYCSSCQFKYKCSKFIKNKNLEIKPELETNISIHY